MPQFRRRGGAVAVTNSVPYRVYFTLDASYKLTGLELTEVEKLQTNEGDHILWHLVSKSNSAPVKVFQYGQLIKGMEQYLPDAQTEPLAAGVAYRLEVSAGSLKGASLPFTIPDIPK
jgi:hypothetical protein